LLVSEGLLQSLPRSPSSLAHIQYLPSSLPPASPASSWGTEAEDPEGGTLEVVVETMTAMGVFLIYFLF
jgi:hypothetical protein